MVVFYQMLSFRFRFNPLKPGPKPFWIGNTPNLLFYLYAQEVLCYTINVKVCVKQDNMKCYVLMLRHELRGKPVEIRRGAAAVREEHCLIRHCDKNHGKADNVVMPEPEDLHKILPSAPTVYRVRLCFCIQKKRTVTSFGVTVHFCF